MRCGVYPRPRGSAPGYQEAHQLTATYTKKVRAGIHAEWRSGKSASGAPSGDLGLRAASIPDSPPTLPTAKTARAIEPAMARTNWKKSVTRTPHSPERVE